MQWSTAKSRLSERPREYPICSRCWSTSRPDFRSSSLDVDRERVEEGEKHQKATRSPNWTWRGPDDVVARPNVALVISLDTPVRFTRLNALKSSPVTSSLVVSPSPGSLNVLAILVFTLAKPGPVNTFRLKLPDTPCRGRGKSAFVKTPFWKSPRE